MQIKKCYKVFITYFMQHQPNPSTVLAYNTPFELLVAVVLSAQCTDRRVNKITPALFAAFPTPYRLAGANTNQVLGYMGSVSYPNNKAKYLVAMARRLVDEFGGLVPRSVCDLQKLAGVGRKTAHVVVSTLYNVPVIAVDTHVFRVSKRLGLVSEAARSPLAVERELMVHLPKKYRTKAHHWFIWHGRHICKAIGPKCGICPFTDFCAFYKKAQWLV